MNILQINQSDISGGAAIAAYRLHEGLLRQNISSYLLVDKVKTGSQQVSAINRRRIDNWLSRISLRVGLDHICYTTFFTIFLVIRLLNQ